MFSHESNMGDLLRVPISHGEGSYQADEDTIAELEASGRVVFRYSGPAGEITPEWNPNGSVNNIAGIMNETGNVLGMMPHPERACDALIGGEDGAAIFRSMFTEIPVLS
jgi:phosphoribosylformylglycinamidine synthase